MIENISILKYWNILMYWNIEIESKLRNDNRVTLTAIYKIHWNDILELLILKYVNIRLN